MNRAERGLDPLSDDEPWAPPPNWGVNGDYHVWSWFQIWHFTDYKQLPFAGGWVDQPVIVQEAFLFFLNLKAWHSQNSHRKAAPARKLIDIM